jgi:hypothetical protein
MAHLVQHTAAGEGPEFTAPGPGSSITIPPEALHTFTVPSPTTTFLVVSQTGATGRFHADFDATMPHGRPIEEAAQEIQQILGRHDVTVAGMQAAR